MRWLTLAGAAGLAACGSSSSTVSFTTSFTITTLAGHGPSPWDVLANQVVTVAVVLDTPDITHSDETVNGDICRATRVTSEDATRTASGSSAGVVQPMILDMLPEWSAQLETCVANDSTYSSTLAILAVIDAINLRFDCSTVPQTVTAHDGAGYPELVTFTGSDCAAQILDVNDNRSLESTGFTVAVDTGGGHVP